MTAAPHKKSPVRSFTPPSGPLGALVRRASLGNSSSGERYSRFVRRMRLVLPVAAFIIVALLFIWPEMDAPVLPSGKDLPARTEQNEVVAPRFESRDDERQPYTVTAKSAVQDSKNSDIIRLEQPVADMTLNSGKWLAGEADIGVFSQSRRTLSLKGHVRLNHDDGYELATEQIEIDLKSRTARADVPIRGHGPAGTVEAQGFFAETDGRRLVFTGPARLVLNRALPGL